MADTDGGQLIVGICLVVIDSSGSVNTAGIGGHITGILLGKDRSFYD